MNWLIDSIDSIDHDRVLLEHLETWRLSLTWLLASLAR